jgi:hypothetical protein
MQIHLTAFAGDCLVSGLFQLRTKHLTDQLNAETEVTLEEAVLDGLDGQRVTVPTFTIERAELCAVVGTPPRRHRHLRDPLDDRRIRAQIGPYVVRGRYRDATDAASSLAFTERDPMVPLTDATIGYVVGGVLELVDASTLIVNRGLAAWSPLLANGSLGDDRQSDGGTAIR